MRRTRHSRYLALLGLTIGLALVLTSCFGGDDSTEDSTEDSTTTPPVVIEPPPPTPPVVIEPPPPPPPVVVELPPPPPPVDVELPPPPPPVDVELPPPLPLDPTEPLIYTVQQGDTLFSIARQFGVDVDELIEVNIIANPDVIYVDDTLTIPPPS